MSTRSLYIFQINQNKTNVNLQDEATVETVLHGKTFSTSCVLSTGHIVMCDWHKREWRINFLNQDGTFTGREAQRVCEHATAELNPYSLLQIMVSCTRYIAVACWMCGMIRLINAQDPSQEPIVAYKGTKVEVGLMCLGPTGTLCSMDRFSGKVYLLDCTSTKFILKRKLSEISNLLADDICYNEDHDLVILCSWIYKRICAVRISDGHIVWDKSKQVVNGKEWHPNCLAYLHDQDLLLVGDQYGERILVLSPNTGNILQTLSPEKVTERINDLHLINDKLVVHHGNKLSFYSVIVNFFTYITINCQSYSNIAK